MSGSDEDDLSAIAWPGFVDILSSVIIMFVFFVMIIAGALFFYMIIFKNQIEATNMVEAEKIVSQDFDIVIKENEDLKIKLEDLEEKVQTFEQKIAQEQANMAESGEQKVTKDSKSITIMFDAIAITVSDAAIKEVQSFVDNYLLTNDASKTTVKILAGKDDNAPTESAASKISVARLFNARNILIKNENFNKENISVEVKPKEKVDGNYSWVRIELSGGGK